MIRTYHEADRAVVQAIYQAAFAGPPWYEQLTKEEVARRWERCTSRRGFDCLVAEIERQAIGFTCWDRPTISELTAERGAELGGFVEASGAVAIIWWRETCVLPAFQKRGIATSLKESIWGWWRLASSPTIVLTRMRQDNAYIIRRNELLGFKSTGIKVPSSQVPGLFHEYWYRLMLQD